jgi:thiamine-monophosphate kinase
LRSFVHATMDISDGLVGDLQHICETSHVGAQIEVDRIPLSDPARAALANGPSLIETVLGGGDDYELLFTASPSHEDHLISLGREVWVPVTRIGNIGSGNSVRVIGRNGSEITLTRACYHHF